MKLEDIIVDPDGLKRELKHQRRHHDGHPALDHWGIRMHRSLSWYARSMQLADDSELSRALPEARLMMLWVSLCALCSSWDSHTQSPVSERLRLPFFLAELSRCAEGDALTDLAGRESASIRRILSSEQLTLEFWRNPFDPAVACRIDSDLAAFAARTPDTVPTLLCSTLDRVHLLRGQLVHGASTAGSRHNRRLLHESLDFMQHLIPVLLHLSIRYGIAIRWPPLCYPPFDPADPASFQRVNADPIDPPLPQSRARR